jgi:hypothetical protein
MQEDFHRAQHLVRRFRVSGLDVHTPQAWMEIEGSDPNRVARLSIWNDERAAVSQCAR